MLVDRLSLLLERLAKLLLDVFDSLLVCPDLVSQVVLLELLVVQLLLHDLLLGLDQLDMRLQLLISFLKSLILVKELTRTLAWSMWRKLLLE